MNQNDVREKVNPVFNTAKMTLYWLAGAGNETAREFLKYIHFDESLVSKPLMSSPETRLSNMISVEERHYMMDHLIMQSGCSNLLDLACGYTPRGIELSGMGINYVGGDLPATISDIKPMAEHFKATRAEDTAERRPGIMRYREVDITNYESVKAAADELNGEVCIVTEGLLMYLTMDEKRMVCENLRRVLQEHGGCWITQDIEAFSQFKAINKPMFGDEFMKQILKARDGYTQKSDVNMTTNSFRTTQDGIDFFNKHGLLVERIPFYSEAVKVNAMDKLQADVAQDMRKRLSECKAWWITADPGYAAPADGCNDSETGVACEKFSIDVQVKNDAANAWESALFIELGGRLDTLTAPELLAAFEKYDAGQQFTNVHLNLSRVQYISSAGLRVLLIMKKSRADRQIVISNASREVKDILEMSGFSTIMTIN